MGIEKIEWITNHPLQKHNYYRNVVYIDYRKFLKFLLQDNKEIKKFYARMVSSEFV
jgi:hypothetical protein